MTRVSLRGMQLKVPTLRSGGDDGFVPATNTLYPATADGVFVWTLEQPTSPDYLDQLRGGWRVQDLQTGGLGLVNNGWEWRLEYQVNGTWTFSWYSVTAGVAAAAIYTQTNIGTVTNVRVTLSGTSITVESSANSEGSYTARGNTTSATHQSNTNLTASYTGATGSQLNLNSNFSAWTSDNPDGWSVISEVAPNNLVTEDANGARIFNDGSTNQFRPAVSQTTYTIGVAYMVYVTLHTLTSGAYQLQVAGTNITLSATGTQARRLVASGTGNFFVPIQFNTNGVVREIQAYALGALDATGDGGFSLLRVS